MPKIFRRLQDSLISVQTVDGSPFPQDQITFADIAGDDVLVNRSGEELDTFRWQNIQQEDGSPAGANKADVMTYLNEQKIPVAVAARFSNIDTTTNLNGGGDFADQLVPICGNESKESPLFTRINDQVFQVDFFGEIAIAVNLHLTGAGARNAMQCRLIRDPLGTPSVEGAIASTGYIRNSTGHAESSLHLTHVTAIGPGTQFGLGIRRESTVTGATTMRFNNSSNISVWRIR